MSQRAREQPKVLGLRKESRFQRTISLDQKIDTPSDVAYHELTGQSG